MSAYRAWPVLSAAIVLTQGIPSYFFRICSSCAVDVAMSVARKWLKTRKLSALASSIEKASSGVHGNGMPSSEVNTGPNRVDHRVLVTGARLPLAWRAWTVTRRLVMACGLPSKRYWVGLVGTIVSCIGVKR